MTEQDRDPGAPSEPDALPDAKAIILARRAGFVAAAMVGMACGRPAPEPPPQPCLMPVWTPPSGDVPAATDAGDGGAPEPPPQPCLSPVWAPPAAGVPALADAGASRAPVPVPPPRVCLSAPLPDPTPKLPGRR